MQVIAEKMGMDKLIQGVSVPAGANGAVNKCCIG